MAHDLLSNTFTLFALFVSLWALINYLRDKPLTGEFWGTIMIGEGIAVAECLVGAILWLTGSFPAQAIHFLYGAIVLFSWPAAYSYARNQDDKRQIMIWFFVSAFLFGVSLRARGTGAL
jgi:hypothetical protein